MKRVLVAVFGILVTFAVAPAFAHSASGAAHSGATPVMHRYLIKRTFSPGALNGLDLAAKKKVNATNARYHVKWIRSYATADKSLTFCIYEAPNEQAIRDAAKANGIPVDQVFAVPVTLMPASRDVVEH